MDVKPNVVDISHYENVQDWDAVKAFGILGVINKATEGPGMTDKTFAIRRNPVARRGLHYGAYHFLRPGGLQLQLSHFLSVAEPDPTLILCVDHEDRRVTLDAMLAFAKGVADKTNRVPWLYSGFLIKEQLAALGSHATDPFLARMPLWLSHYSAHPAWPTKVWPSPRLWQFTGDGLGPAPHRVPGILLDGQGGLDINSYSGTPEQLALDWA